MTRHANKGSLALVPCWPLVDCLTKGAIITELSSLSAAEAATSMDPMAADTAVPVAVDTAAAAAG